MNTNDRNAEEAQENIFGQENEVVLFELETPGSCSADAVCSAYLVDKPTLDGAVPTLNPTRNGKMVGRRTDDL